MWSTEDLASATGLTERYIRYLIAHDKVKAQKISTVWVITDEEAQRFIESRRDSAGEEITEEEQGELKG